MLNAGVSLTATLAIFSYAINLEFSRAYVVIALPSVTLFDLGADSPCVSDCTSAAPLASACTAWWRWAMNWRSLIWSLN